MPPEVRAESRAKQGELAITGHNDESHQASKCFATSAFSFNRNESRNGRLLHGMQGVSGSNPLGSIPTPQARHGFFNALAQLRKIALKTSLSEMLITPRSAAVPWAVLASCAATGLRPNG